MDRSSAAQRSDFQSDHDDDEPEVPMREEEKNQGPAGGPPKEIRRSLLRSSVVSTLSQANQEPDGQYVGPESIRRSNYSGGRSSMKSSVSASAYSYADIQPAQFRRQSTSTAGASHADISLAEYNRRQSASTRGPSDGVISLADFRNSQTSGAYGHRLNVGLSEESMNEYWSDDHARASLDRDRRNKPTSEAKAEVQAAAQREIWGVRLWKGAFLFLAAATAALVSAGTYVFLKAEQDENYEQSYDHLTNAMKEVVNSHVESIYVGFESFSKLMSSDAVASGATFPFYTMKNFEAAGETFRRLSGSEMITWNPIVEEQNEQQWLNYSQINQGWLDSSRQWALHSSSSSVQSADYRSGPIATVIFDLGGPDGTERPSQSGPPYAPLWMTSPPVLDPQSINMDFQFFEFANTAYKAMQQDRTAFFSRLLVERETELLSSMISTSGTDSSQGARGVFFQPVFVDGQDPSSKLVGFFSVEIAFDLYLKNLVPEGVEALYCVVRNTCGQSLTYRLAGNQAFFLGPDDLHDRSYDSTEYVVQFSRPLPDGDEPSSGHCIFSFHIYSSSEFEDSHHSTTVVVLTCVVAGAFAFLIASFLMYDMFVRRRNAKVLSVATKSSELVSSLFPKTVRDRLYQEKEALERGSDSANFMIHHAKLNVLTEENESTTLGGLLEGEPTERSVAMDDEGFMYKSTPIADLYPDCTVMFADVVGFTAWSSSRDPTEVFTLLETLYKAFDTIAKRRRVFKVETIGDCYVAVAGLPEPMKDHPITMCRFAKDILSKTHQLTRKLEAILGPDTADLDLRIGLHSGSVTAGVLRGDKSRFQLFGDTMNTASRMESTGRKGKIQVSQETADLLELKGKSHWLKPRDDKVQAKGKGELQTYWMTASRHSKGTAGSVTEPSIGRTEGTGSDSGFNDSGAFSSSDFCSSHGGSDFDSADEDLGDRNSSAVTFNVELLANLLNMIAETRSDSSGTPIDRGTEHTVTYGPSLLDVQDSIAFPAPKVAAQDDMTTAPLDALAQLHNFVSSIASLHPDHPYHDFSHSSHVSQSVVKLLSHLKESGDSDVATPGSILSADPMAQFACVLAALVQDVAHPGLPNFVLAQEQSSLVEEYGDRCIAEQGSVDSAWELLMNRNYVELRSAIYRTQEEKERFRQLFVNCMMATDLFDEKLAEKRDSLWEKAFGESPEEDPGSKLDLQATLLLESIIQASDMVHTIQHWDVYRKWSSRLFEEVYRAHLDGRIEKDPSDTWFDSELAFFDNVVFPMTKKLSDCGAFEESALQPYLDFARTNRLEWETDGKTIVAELLEQCRQN